MSPFEIYVVLSIIFLIAFGFMAGYGVGYCKAREDSILKRK
jgi:hypothetical protein